MDIPSHILSQFVKTTNDTPKEEPVTMYGTVVKNGDALCVKIDGSEILTPVDTVSDLAEGERVTVSIENHTAIVTGNVSSPSTSMVAVDKKLKTITLTADQINLHGYVTANSGFYIDTKGSMTARNGTFTGKIEGASTITIGTASDGSDAFKVASNGVVSIGNISQDGETASFRVGNTGTLRIGGLSAHVHSDGITKGVAEITSQGTIYSCSTVDPETYVMISEGVLRVCNTVYDSDGKATAETITISDEIKIGDMMELYGNRIASKQGAICFDDILDCDKPIRLANAAAVQGYDEDLNPISLCHVGADNISKFGWGSWNTHSDKAYSSGAQYMGGSYAELRSKNQVIFGCDGADHTSKNGAAIVFFKNSADTYVMRSISDGGGVGVTTLGTSTFPWYSVSAINVNQTSDRKTKENIEYLNDYNLYNARASNHSYISTQQCYDFIKNDCMLATYNHINDTRQKINFIANDILVNADGSDNIIGQLIVTLSNPEDEDNGILTFDTTNYISVVVGALQKAIAKIEELESRL